MSPEDRYDIIKLLHKGRTGGTYQAEDRVLQRQISIRRLYSVSGSTETAHYKDLFLTISQQLAAIKHPGISTTLDAGIDIDGAYLVSELREGQSLLTFLQSKSKFSELDALDISRQILEALTHAHQHHFFHGALSLSSIFLESRERGGYRAIITDLGLGYLAPLIQGENSNLANLADPAMSAPELREGALPSESSDLYSCGHLFYTILAGGHPFANISADEAHTKNKRDLLPYLSDVSETSERTSDWIHQLILAKPQKRTASIAHALIGLPTQAKVTNIKHRLELTETKKLLSRSNVSLRQSSTSKPVIASSSKLPVIITILLFAACSSIGWLALRQKSNASNRSASLELRKNSEQTTPEISLNTPKERKNLKDKQFLAFSKARSIYAQWYFSPDYFEGQNFDYYYAKRSKLKEPPDFKEGLLLFDNGQMGLGTRELAYDIPREQFSLEAFVKVEKLETLGGIISCSEDDTAYRRGFYIGYNESGDATFKVSSSKKTTVIRSNNTPFSKPEWVHLVGVFRNQDLNLYVNGQLASYEPHGHNMTMAKKTPDFTLGGYKDTDTQTTMTGQIKNAAIYRAALTLEEVTELYEYRTLNLNP